MVHDLTRRAMLAGLGCACCTTLVPTPASARVRRAGKAEAAGAAETAEQSTAGDREVIVKRAHWRSRTRRPARIRPISRSTIADAPSWVRMSLTPTPGIWLPAWSRLNQTTSPVLRSTKEA